MSMIEKCEKLFAEKFGAKYAIAMNSGTATLHSALYAVGMKEGSKVISPALTVFMDTSATIHAQADPVFADIDQNNWMIIPDTIEKTKSDIDAIIAVGLYGAEIPKETIDYAKDKKIPIIEDNAQAFNLRFFGDMASYSFESSKHISCGEGGMLITNNESYARYARMFANHGFGFSRAESTRTKLTDNEMSNPEYQRHYYVGYNYRMPEVCAEMLYPQIENIEKIIEQRKMCADIYKAAIPEEVYWLVQQKSNGLNSFWTFPLSLRKGNISDFIKKFREYGGDPVRAAWQIPYHEYSYSRLGKLSSRCFVAEDIQPTLMQFKTNYKKEREMVNQAKILSKTIQAFGEEYV